MSESRATAEGKDEGFAFDSLHQELYQQMVARMDAAFLELDQNREELARKLKELEETREFTETVLNTMLDGLVVVDRGGVITRVNPAASRLLRLPAEQLVGRRATDALPFEVPLDPARLPFEGEARLGGVPVLVNAAAILALGEEHVGTVVAVKDITQIKEFESLLEQKRRELERQVEHKQAELERRVLELEEARRQLQRSNAQLQAERDRIRRAAGDIARASRDHESMAAQLATAVTELTTSLHELAQTADQVASHVDAVAGEAAETSTVASEGQGLMESLVEEVTVLREGSAAIAERIGRLSARSQEIGRILDLIQHVADRTDLLALNAAIEGAHAGAAGRGFGVVAAEMRRLAENVSQHAGEIKRVIEEVQAAIRASVLATEDGIKRTEHSGAVAERAGDAFRNIYERIQRTAEAGQLIRVATQQQRLGTTQMVQGMDDIRDAARRSHDATRKTTSALGELQDQPA